jgi:hypothetical protein
MMLCLFAVSNHLAGAFRRRQTHTLLCLQRRQRHLRRHRRQILGRDGLPTLLRRHRRRQVTTRRRSIPQCWSERLQSSISEYDGLDCEPRGDGEPSRRDYDDDSGEVKYVAGMLVPSSVYRRTDELTLPLRYGLSRKCIYVSLFSKLISSHMNTETARLPLKCEDTHALMHDNCRPISSDLDKGRVVITTERQICSFDRI